VDHKSARHRRRQGKVPIPSITAIRVPLRDSLPITKWSGSDKVAHFGWGTATRSVTVVPGPGQIPDISASYCRARISIDRRPAARPNPPRPINLLYGPRYSAAVRGMDLGCED